MDQKLQQILEEYKKETGKNLWIQEENGAILASTLEPREHFLRETLSGREAAKAVGSQAQTLGWQAGREHCLFLVEVSGREQNLVREVAANVLEEALEEHFWAWLPEGLLALVLSLPEGTLSEAEELAAFLQAGVEAEVQVRARIGISCRFREAEGLLPAREEAETALLACRKIYREQYIAAYERLGLGLAACQMQPTEAGRYIAGVLGPEPEKVLEDEELLHTVKVLLANNLNGAETARQLYVHRNTLTYRLDKIEKLTGRDLRQFADASAFCLAMLLWEAGLRR